MSTDLVPVRVGQWAVKLDDHGTQIIRADVVTPGLLKYNLGHNMVRQFRRAEIVAAFDSKDEANSFERMIEALRSARGRALQAVLTRYQEACAPQKREWIAEREAVDVEHNAAVKALIEEARGNVG